MKQLVLTVGIALVATLAVAQKGKVIDAAMAYKDFRESAADQNMEQATKDIMDAKKYIDLACDHPDTKDEAKTLMYKGKIYIEASAMVAAADDKTPFGDMDAEESAEEGFNALIRSKEVDEKERYVDDVDAYANQYRVAFSNMGITAYGEEKYDVAMGALLGAAKFGEILGVTDSNMYFYGGLAAYSEKEYEAAENAFTKCVEINFNTGESIGYLARSLKEQGKTEKAEKALKTAASMYPNNLDVLIQLTNYYIDSDNNAEAEKVLSEAIKLDPENTALVYTSGTIYETMGRFEDAEAAYKKTLTIEPDNTNAKFAIGGLYFNKGADLYNEANTLPFGDPNYEKMRAESTALFEQALPYLEEASAAEPKDVVILESLKAVYGKLSMTDKFLETKKKIEALKG